ncbi:hypothetical protein LUQ84_001999 [Hamiltosporidium tvaerminnensis]|nr:hypothetical protein LUQ84_001999 [Hamiltosporidium tvaerminnensis]
MHEVFTNTISSAIIYGKNSSLFFMVVLLIVGLKVESRMVFHLYDENECKTTDIDCYKREDIEHSRFIEKKFNCYQHNNCFRCKKIIIEKSKDFPLKFKSVAGEETDVHAFIRREVVTYDDFSYFIRILMNTSELNESLRIEKFLMIVNIIDIFEFEKNKNYGRFIRRILLPTIFSNQINDTKDGSCVQKDVSISFLKILFCEFIKIYIFDKKFFDQKISEDEITNILKHSFDINSMIKIKFIYFSSDLLAKIDRCLIFNPEFKYSLKTIFQKVRIQKIFVKSHDSLNHVSYDTQYLLFSNAQVLYFHSWLDMNFFESLARNFILQNIESIYFISCDFLSFSESFFNNLKSLKNIYLIDSYSNGIENLDKIYPYIQNMISPLYFEIKSKKNIDNFVTINTNEPYIFENIDKNSLLTSNESLITPFEFKTKQYQTYFFSTIQFDSSVFRFSFSVLNSSHIAKEISIIIQNIYIKGFIIENACIYKNIRKISIWGSILTNKFLADILIFPNLEDINISSCKVLSGQKILYKRHENMKILSFLYTFIDNSKEIIDFVNCMPNLKSMDLRKNTNLNIFNHYSQNNKITLNYLENLYLFDENKYKNDIPDISNLKSVTSLRIGKEYSYGSIHKLFYDKNLKYIQILSITKFKIGKSDMYSLQECKNLIYLYLYNCKFTDISFSQLFDSNKSYKLEKIFLKKMFLTATDIKFLSKCIFLKHLELQIYNVPKELIEWLKLLRLDKSKSILELVIHISSKFWIEIGLLKEYLHLNTQKLYII